MAHVGGPSTYEKHPELPEQASAAALYVTHPENATNVRDSHPSEADQRLSSAGASTSLKYAKKEDLPSYPIVGTDLRSSAGAAANMANSHQKSPALWKPGVSASAGKAALLAHRDGGKVNLWSPEQTKEGNLAAGSALRKKGLAPELDYGYTAEGHKKALVAATGAVSTSRRPASFSSHDEEMLPRGALNAATVANQPSAKRKTEPKRSSFAADGAALEAARVQHLGRNVSRDMFGEHPPSKFDEEEKRRQDAIHASAVSMAKQMDDVIQKKGYYNRTTTPGSAGRIAVNKAESVRKQQSTAAADDLRQQALQYIHLQDAARRSATERLKKLYTDDEVAFRDYYGYSPAPPQRSRLSVIGRPRGRASSESNPRRRRLRDNGNADDSSDDDDDALRASALRRQQQPTSFRDQMAPQFNEKKRQQDRVNLLAAAQRNVQSSLTTMDKRVYDQTGKVPLSMQKEWDAKAKAKAQATAENEARVAAATHGKIDVGGGKFVDQAEVEAIASKRVQPTLDEINDKAERQRAEEAEKRRLAQLQKEQEANLKMVMKKEKEEKHAHREGKLKSFFGGKKSSHGDRAHDTSDSATTATGPSTSKAVIVPSTETTVVAQPAGNNVTTTNDVKGEKSPSSPGSPIKEQTPKTQPTKSESAKSEPKVLNVLFSRLKRKSKHEESGKVTTTTTATATTATATTAAAPATTTTITETTNETAVATSAPLAAETPAIKEEEEEEDKSPTTAGPVSENKQAVPVSPTPLSALASENASTRALRGSQQPSPPPSPRQTDLPSDKLSSLDSLSDINNQLAASPTADAPPQDNAQKKDAELARDNTVDDSEGEENRSRFAKSLAAESRDRDSDGDYQDAKDTKDVKGAAPTSVPTSTEGKVEGEGDDNLAPPRASFASRTKSESPARDSKFQEQL